jgi:hypothetical protein
MNVLSMNFFPAQFKEKAGAEYRTRFKAYVEVY